VDKAEAIARLYQLLLGDKSPVRLISHTKPNLGVNATIDKLCLLFGYRQRSRITDYLAMVEHQMCVLEYEAG